MKKKIAYTLLSIVIVAAVGALGYRGYIGMVAGDGEISREVQADRSFSDEAEARETGSTSSIIQYGVTSGESGESVARFLILEQIFGRENMVEGTTRQIDGSFLINYLASTVRVGQFEINVRDIETRSLDVNISERGWTDGERDVVIRGQILESGRDEYEFSTFDPDSVTGVPDSFDIGDTLELVVTGDLTIKGVTSEVSFDMELNLDSEEQISGFASTEIRWADFGITVPYVGGGSDVDAVADSVELQLEFTAEEEGRLGTLPSERPAA
ncbi:MAG: YceI family protein [Alkalispirochaetaceae bacterium]